MIAPKPLSVPRLVFAFSALLAAGAVPVMAQGANDTVWTRLWTGTNLADWEPKFMGYATGVNHLNTFRAADGNLEVNYSGYTNFNGTPFGHAAYKPKQFSFYLLRAEYQVWGEQVANAPSNLAWANQNNGFMLHAQWPMSQGQDFPVSLEAQLLGPANGSASPGAKGTMNLCTPGTRFYDNPTGGSANTSHCVAAAANPRAPVNTGWNYVAALVLGDSVVRHYVGTQANFLAQNVLTFYRPHLDNGTRLTQGYITIQAESHPYRFRRIEVAELIGCMTPTSPNYKSYYVRHSASACTATPVRAPEASSDAFAFDPATRRLSVNLPGEYAVKVADLSGRVVGAMKGAGRGSFDLHSVSRPGVHILAVAHSRGVHTQKVMLP